MIAPIIGGLGSPFGSIVGAIFRRAADGIFQCARSADGYYGVNTLVYGIVILGVIAFLPEAFGRVLRYMNSIRVPPDASGPYLTRAFRGLVAVKDVSFDVEDNEIVALIGPNGAGKTTCFNMIPGAETNSRFGAA